MEIKGSYAFDAQVEKVWDLLLDPEAVAVCLPGCEELSPIGNDQYRARMTVSVAAITGKYEGSVTIAERQPPHSYQLIVEGRGAGGFVRGQSFVTLAGQGAQTLVNVRADVHVGGTIARIGQRLLGSVAKMMMDRFYACLQSRIPTNRNATVP